MSTTSKRPSVAKLSFHVTPGHSRLIFSDTSLAKALKSLGSSKACGEMRLRITYVAIWHLPYYPRTTRKHSSVNLTRHTALDFARITGAESAHITEGVICTAHHHFVAATRFLRARRFCSSTTTSLLATYEVSVLRNHGIEVEPAADFSSARSLQ